VIAHRTTASGRPVGRTTTDRRTVTRSSRVAGRGLLLVTLVVLGLGCARSNPSTASPSTISAGPVPTTAASTPPATLRVAGGRARLAGFREVTVTVVDDQGRTRTFCLLLAADAASRERGLMFVEDPDLGGYDGMLFRFGEDTTDGFWMKNTKLPLSIVYLSATGSTVSTTDMAPCPASTTNCPAYPAAAPYRDAIEVPQGRLAALGISEGSRVTIGAETCAARTATSS
jgi:uncharacterized membrane protein (UPF0127 family)